MVANEQLCLLMAKELGIEIPESFIVKTDGRNSEDVLFATSRYDRKFASHPGKLNGLSVPYRLHQEDFFPRHLEFLPLKKIRAKTEEII